MNKFILIPTDVLLCKYLSDRDKIVYFKLCKYAFDSVSCYPSLETLAESTGVSKDTIKRAIKSLREIGLVKVYRESITTSNKYVLIPLEWVKNLGSKEIMLVAEAEQYIETREEFENLLGDIANYYTELGKNISSAATSKNPKKKKAGKTIGERILDLEQSLEAGNYELTAQDYVVYFVKCVRDLHGGDLYKVTWASENKIMKDMFVDNEGISQADAMKIIYKYVEVYKKYFAKGGYTDIKVRWLRASWVFNKVNELVKMDNVTQANKEVQFTEEEF